MENKLRKFSYMNVVCGVFLLFRSLARFCSMRRYVRDYYVNDFVYLSVQWLWVFHCSECTCHINYWRKDYARMMFALFSSCFLFSIALFSSFLAPSLPVYPNTPKTISHLPEPHILKRNICDINELT